MTPILRSTASKIIKDEVSTSIASGEELDTKEFSQLYTMSAIMTAGFSIGKCKLYSNKVITKFTERLSDRLSENNHLVIRCSREWRANEDGRWPWPSFSISQFYAFNAVNDYPGPGSILFQPDSVPSKDGYLLPKSGILHLWKCSNCQSKRPKGSARFCLIDERKHYWRETEVNRKQRIYKEWNCLPILPLHSCRIWYNGKCASITFVSCYLLTLDYFYPETDMLLLLRYALALNPESQEELYQLIIQVVKDRVRHSSSIFSPTKSRQKKWWPFRIILGSSFCTCDWSVNLRKGRGCDIWSFKKTKISGRSNQRVTTIIHL